LCIGKISPEIIIDEHPLALRAIILAFFFDEARQTFAASRFAR
jgi:hypothetical protein